MGERVKIGLLFSYDTGWIGGSYYIINIINMLKYIDDKDKPFLQIICSNKEDFKHIHALNYPYIEYIHNVSNLSVTEKIINKISYTFFKKNWISLDSHLNDVKIIFPCVLAERFERIKHKVFWIPDFQDRHLKHLFSPEALQKRIESQSKIAQQKQIVFSSQNAKTDFDTYFPDSKINKYVFNFTSILPKYEVSIRALRDKYALTDQNYFFSPNQFWQHKNHIVILKAIKKMKAGGTLDFQVYFSGKEYDHRNSDYFNDILAFCTENDLMSHVKFLGFIDREDQVCFMDHAIGIIQPSFFEGWSTVVEDAKALNQNIIASNIEVHQEQLKEKAFYFDPNNENELIEQLQVVSNLKRKVHDYKYEELIRMSALHFRDIMKQVEAS